MQEHITSFRDRRHSLPTSQALCRFNSLCPKLIAKVLSLPDTHAIMASSSDLAVVLCHGSYHTPAPYGPLLEALQAGRGIEAYCPQLPTADLSKLNVGDVHSPDFDRGPPPEGYPQGEEDTNTVLDVLKPLVEAGKEVLLVAHSSGGWVATQAARPELQAKVRKSKGLVGGNADLSISLNFAARLLTVGAFSTGIIGILYAGAFVVPVGESIHSFFQPKDGNFVTPPFMTFHVSRVPAPKLLLT
jgi:hypothetical protein